MQRFGQQLRCMVYGVWCMVLTMLLCSCEGTTFTSSVPTYPLRVVINMDLGQFVHFQNKTLGDYIEVHDDGFHYHDQVVLPLGTNACGYGGVVCYVSVNGYDAYDMACPHCAKQRICSPCTIDGMYAECPVCGEQYDLASGTAAPQKGLIRETLRRLKVIQSGNTLTITQQ